MRLDKKSCLCPYCGETLLKKNCSECSHKDFMFEDVCFCPHCEAYFMQEEPLTSHTNISTDTIYTKGQMPIGRFYQ